MDRCLIYDLGMYDGADTEFYLKKGFRVVAVDANPILCQQAQTRFAAYINTGRLTILNCGIAGSTGIGRFNINVARPDRSSFISTWCPDDKKEVVSVRCVKLDNVLAKYGIPYYLKIDLEHLDYVCIDALEGQAELPAFVSVETGKTHFINKMSSLGYTRFKVISQVYNQSLSMPYPSLEGTYVNQRFTDFHSGPFGNETYGEWITGEEASRELEMIARLDYEGSRHKLLGCPQNIFVTSWYDIHACLPEQAELTRR